MTTKQRAALRSMGAMMEPILHIGKDGIGYQKSGRGQEIPRPFFAHVFRLQIPFQHSGAGRKITGKQTLIFRRLHPAGGAQTQHQIFLTAVGGIVLVLCLQHRCALLHCGKIPGQIGNGRKTLAAVITVGTAGTACPED